MGPSGPEALPCSSASVSEVHEGVSSACLAVSRDSWGAAPKGFFCVPLAPLPEAPQVWPPRAEVCSGACSWASSPEAAGLSTAERGYAVPSTLSC